MRPRTGDLNARRADDACRPPSGVQLVAVVAARATPAAATTATAIAARPVLLRRPRRGILRPLDQLLRLDEIAVLVLRDEFEADPAASLVDLLDDDVDDVAAAHHVLDVGDTARTHVRDVEETVRPL